MHWLIDESSGQQDSQLVNPYPAGLTLDGSNLAAAITATTNASSPIDTVLIFDIDGTSGQNISAAATYLYYEDGGVNDGGRGGSGVLLLLRTVGCAKVVVDFDWLASSSFLATINRLLTSIVNPTVVALSLAISAM